MTTTIKWILCAILVLAFSGAASASGDEPQHGPALGEKLPLWSILPFVGILLSIALFPLAAPHTWHRHYAKISLAWAVTFAVPFLWSFGTDGVHEILHTYFIEYFPFIILLWGLYTAAGGIVIRGTMAGTPRVNLGFLALGTLLASWIGTTGAAMLLIRPMLRANASRKHKVHVVVFFIFLVANIGGALTPLGDPPLFLGFIHKVPFFWTLKLLPHMSFAVVLLLTAFYFIDRRYYLMEKAAAARSDSPEEPPPGKVKLRVDGLYNLLFLGGIMGAVLLSGIWHARTIHVLGVAIELQNWARDGLILLMGGLSLWFTPKRLRTDNEFSWEPIREVAFLFAGIFMTIIPALAILKVGEKGQLASLISAVKEPVHYFWVTGILSSFLDNAPTYLTFFNTQLGRFYPGIPEAQAVPRLIAENGLFLKALSAGAVFMGANTYIGNAPNFMVKAIAEEAGVAMPSFFGYLFRWALPILLPVFLLLSLVFF